MRGLRGAMLPFAAGAAVLLASLLNYLGHNDYPLLTAEAALVAAGLLATCAAASILYGAAGAHLRMLLDILLVYLALDLNFDGVWVSVAAVAVAIVLNRHLLPAVALIFGVVLAAQIVGLAAGGGSTQARPHPVNAATGSGPALVHLILDEHIGIEGLPDDMPEAQTLRTQLKGFYRDAGFRLFGGAYSEFFRTTDSIPQILNFGVQQPWSPDHQDSGMSLRDNAYFERLGALGYAVNVYQTDFLDFCAGAVVRSCAQRPAADIAAIPRSGLPTSQKAALLAHGLASLSGLAVTLSVFHDTAALAFEKRTGVRLPLLGLEADWRASTLGALQVFDRLIVDLERAEPGQAYFAHLLVPHYPYITARDCTVRNRADWMNRRSFRDGLKRRQLAYFAQLACVQTKLGEALAALARSPAGADTVVIIHGDHGSRITRQDPVAESVGAKLDDRDLIGSYSTLFAIRAAGIEAGYDPARIPVAQLLAAAVESGFGETPLEVSAAKSASVMLEDATLRPVLRHALPDSWVKPYPAATKPAR